MLIFAIKENKNNKVTTFAHLVYFERAKEFHIDIMDDVSKWEAPLIISSFIKKGKKSVDANFSKLWVRQRIIPSDRQNLGQILKNNNMSEYDEFQLLLASRGRCAQDDYYISPISKTEYQKTYSERLKKRVLDVTPLSNQNMLVFFADKTVKKVNTSDAQLSIRVLDYLNNDNNFTLVEPIIGGYGVKWGNIAQIDNEKLYEIGIDIGLTLNDFAKFAKHGILSASEAANKLNCSRQNISLLCRSGKLQNLSDFSENTEFLASEVYQRAWH